MKLKTIFVIVIALFSLMAQNAAGEITLTYAPPCLIPSDIAACPDVSDSIADYLLRLYNFSLGIVGTIAFGAIVVGGIFIAFSGVADKKKEGKEMIAAALWGIAILLGSYLILNTVNPEIPKLREPALTRLTLEELQLELPTISEGKLVACGQLNKNGTPTNPENVCGNTDEWPFVAIIGTNTANAKDPQIGDKPGWDCKDPLENPGAGPGGTQWQACAPSDLNNVPNRAYFAFFVDGIRDFKMKALRNKVYAINLEPINEPDLPIKNSGATCNEIGLDGQMMGCVCTWKVGQQTNCQVNGELKDSLIGLDETYEINSISWQITEAYPPTVMHNDNCHFRGTCVDIGIIRQGNDCAVVLQAKQLAENLGLKVLNEYPACRGVNTDYATGGHLHVSL